MIWGLFSALAGFLLPAALAVRLAGEIAGEPGRLGHPVMLWRVQLFLLLLIPTIASMPGAIALFVATPTRSGEIILRFGETRFGLAVLVAKIVAVLMVDAVKPRVEAQLERPPVTEISPTRAYLVRDVSVILICLALAWAATWWSATR